MSKTVFITGTSTGFGKLTAITLAGAGHSVIAGMRNVTGSSTAAAGELSRIDNIEVVEIDITSDSSVKEAIRYTLNKYGEIV